MIKLFVSDLDGTLLNEHHVISDRTAEAIRALQDNGIEFMVATGREYFSAHQLLSAHNIHCRMINLNGAVIHDDEGNVLKTQPIEAGDFATIIKHIEDPSINATVITDKGFYVSDYENYVQRMKRFINNPHTEQDSGNEDITVAQLSLLYREIKPLSQLDSKQLPVVYKVMFFSSDLDKLGQTRRNIETLPTIDVTSSNHDNLEITHIKAQKGLAIEEYVRTQDYTMAEVAAIGDSLNDRSMIQMVGHSYAMANGVDSIKESARYLAPSNELDGVAQVINQIIDNPPK
ncbi:Cof-type HAD-IIB family hydrolase [Fundicoccus culcitae]|uniref:Cof-type HAD-IIB family hydrolase n=1 Tax=Fundicoccus culcitae TaxID=2969821 RepID=A0ABY5P2R3_9LACT|nr:Cof-type HAD-IIB family hydrolase [Fundicoccus culcitae]UUX33017.1 Cof-type HAD-IIB family hydrolase [Fundicoccus culcitae]